MKKLILSVAVVVLGFAATSCKKYTCTCRSYDANGNITGTTTSSTSASTLAGAEIKCEDKTTGSTMECE